MFPQTIKIRVSWHCPIRQSSLEKSKMSGNLLFTSFSVLYFSTLDINTTHSTWSRCLH